MTGAASLRSRRGATGKLVSELIRGSTPGQGQVSYEKLTSLPAPVERYLRTVLQDGQAGIELVRVAQAGEFRSKESPDPEAGWRPFEATQLFTAEPPGFVWEARVSMAPLLSVRVRDAYVSQHASLQAAMLGIIKLAGAADDPQLRTGALQRYLAESVWFPTALLPRPRLRWSPIDQTHARATLVDGDTTASLEFEFGSTGEIVACYAPSRPRAVSGAPGGYEMFPWGGRYRRYDERAGVRIPLESEVYWVVNGMEQPYYRGRNLRITYDLGQPPAA